MQKFFILSFILTSLIAQEPSAFNAGGNVPQKSGLQILNEKLFNLSVQIKTLDESQEGLRSVFEGQTLRIQELSNNFISQKDENQTALKEVRAHVDSNFALQNENIEKIKQSISALSTLIKNANTQMQSEIEALKAQIITLQDSKNSNFKEIDKITQQTTSLNIESQNSQENVEVAQKSINIETEKMHSINNESQSIMKVTAQNISNTQNVSNVEDSNVAKQSKLEFKEKKVESKKEVEIKDSIDLKKLPLASVYKQGEDFYKAKNYAKADEYLQFAVKGNYKPARGNYLLGDIAFEEKRYEDAIYYYKVSATRYDKADYMPRLMLNSAKSFNALKEQENAKRFFETLIALYPNSLEAKEAKTLLK